MHIVTAARFFAARELPDQVAIHNGIRRRCPFAPVLFVLAVDPLYETVDCDPGLPGVQLSVTARVALVGFADDTKAYLRHPKEEPVLLRLLDDFSALSSLRVKMHVSQLHQDGPTQTYTAMSLPLFQAIASAPAPAHIWALTLQPFRAMPTSLSQLSRQWSW